ncbi:MAG: hypothetical protein HYS56_00900 [Candidatus Omnitrophica bacterium]|nr:hypothetical protein [Candidatus Omnitrophota bacterium]
MSRERTVRIKMKWVWFLCLLPAAVGANDYSPLRYNIPFSLAVPGPAARTRTALSFSGPLRPQTFLTAASQTAADLEQGTLGDITVGSNIKEMTPDMRRLYDDSDHDLTAEAENAPLEVVRSYEDPAERRHDLPGALGIIQTMKKSNRWAKPAAVVMILDGGFKTRFAYKVLSEGWAGLTRLPGKRYRNLRHIVLVNMLTILRMLPEGLERYVGLASSDNFIFLGQATLGRILLNDSRGIRPLLERASVVKGAARMKLLTERDRQRLERLKTQPEKWTEEEVKAALAERWTDVARQISEAKLEQVGVIGVDSAGKMTGFLEKANRLEIIRFSYQHGGVLYKNAFQEFLDKRFAARLMERFIAEKAETDGFQTLDQFPIGYMQTVYQSQFTSPREWDRLCPSKENLKVAPQDWRRIREIVKELFEEEQQQGRGEVCVFDFGQGHLRAHLGDLEEWNTFLNWAVTNPLIREMLGMRVTGKLDPATVRLIRPDDVDFSDGTKIRISQNAYVERTIISGGGALIVEDGALLSSVRIHIPAGKELVVRRGVKIMESELDLSQMGVELEPNTIVERVFPVPGVTGRLIARSEERVTVLKIGGQAHLARNLRPIQFAGKNVGELIPSQEQWLELQRRHPEYLSQYPYEKVKGRELIELADQNLGGLSFRPAQRQVDYLWMQEQVKRLQEGIDADVTRKHPSDPGVLESL